MSQYIGQVIANRYEVKALLGRGGMAEVYLATDRETRSEVALKLVLPDPEHSDLAGRFLRGARLSRKIRHPFVTSTFDLGQWGDPVQGYYMAMEYVDGLALSDLLDVGLGVGSVCTLVSQVLAALAYVHAHGVLHRDIKPGNIMVYRCSDGALQTKLTDFGIAASLSRDINVAETGADVVVGTPAYMAPEQVQQCGVYAPALDLYAVGTTLYRMMSGTLPFNKTGLALVVARVTDDPAPLKPRPGMVLPDALNHIVMKLLSRRPEDRYPMAADVLRRLVRFCEPAKMSIDEWQSLFESPHSVPTISSEVSVANLFDFLDETFAVSNTTLAGAPGAFSFDMQPLWGQEDFIHRFDALIDAAEQGRGQVGMLSGPTGIGKTSIMQHMAFALAEQGRFIVLRTAYHTHGGGASGLRYAVEKHLGTVGRSVDTVRQAILEFLRRYDDVDSQEADDLMAFLRPRAPVEGADRPDGLNFNFALVLRMLRRISRVKPVVLVLDSMEQGGVEAASFISHLQYEIRLDPFPILCLGAFSDRLADDGFQRVLKTNDRYIGESFHRFVVPPLSSEAMTRGLIENRRVDPRTAALITQQAQGNPLFAVHLARAGSDALDAGFVFDRAHSQQVDLPEQLAAVLALSLDESLGQTPIPDRLREVCRCIAILGDNVRVDLLRSYFDALELGVDTELPLDLLIDVGLLVEGPIHADERVSLQPSLLKELLLSETPPRKRRRMEKLAAAVRIRWAADNPDAAAGAIGDHLEAAGEADDAVDWWRRCLPFEVLAGHPIKGVRAGLKGLEHIDQTSPEYADLAMAVGQLLLDMGELTDAAAVLAPVVLCSNADWALRAGDLLADVYENAGQGAKWDSLIEAMTRREAEAGPHGLRALYSARSFWLNAHGHRDKGFREAQNAMVGATAGREAQRAAQRLVYTCLSRGDLELGEETARQALEHAGKHPELMARSLRALGVVLVWKQRGDDAVVCFNALHKLINRHGLIARRPIVWHDLGDAYRVGGQLTEARDKYNNALGAAIEMQLHSSEQLIRVKLIICDLLEGATEGIETVIQALMPTATASGLALAEPFGQMLLAWAYALDGNPVSAQSAYDSVPDMRDMAIDPQFPLIMEQIGSAFAAAANSDHAREALSLAAQFWLRYGQPESAARCQSQLEAV